MSEIATQQQQAEITAAGQALLAEVKRIEGQDFECADLDSYWANLALAGVQAVLVALEAEKRGAASPKLEDVLFGAGVAIGVRLAQLTAAETVKGVDALSAGIMRGQSLADEAPTPKGPLQ